MISISWVSKIGHEKWMIENILKLLKTTHIRKGGWSHPETWSTSDGLWSSMIQCCGVGEVIWNIHPSQLGDKWLSHLGWDEFISRARFALDPGLKHLAMTFHGSWSYCNTPYCCHAQHLNVHVKAVSWTLKSPFLSIPAKIWPNSWILAIPKG